MNKKVILLLVAGAATSFASAELMDKPGGIKYGEHLILRPHVSLSYTYDSNVDSSKRETDSNQWTVDPTLDFEYKLPNESFKLIGSIFYRYHAHERYEDELNESSYGERLQLGWMNEAKGWAVSLSEEFRQISQDDDMTNDGGRGMGRDRRQFTLNGAVNRIMNSHWRWAVDASYYFLDYDNNVKKYAPMYGWTRAQFGAEVGFAPGGGKTDLILRGAYQWYSQDNDRDIANSNANVDNFDDTSRGYTLMAGFGSRATERISYRLLAGWSRFEYGDTNNSDDGFTYEGSLNWKLSEADQHALNLMALASSYYQPSETQYGSATKVYSFSVGMGKGLVQNKLNATVDFCYRREDSEYMGRGRGNKNSEDIITARLGLNYTLNQFMAVFGRMEYQWGLMDVGAGDYDRWRATVGVRFSY